MGNVAIPKLKKCYGIAHAGPPLVEHECVLNNLCTKFTEQNILVKFVYHKFNIYCFLSHSRNLCIRD